MADLADVRIRDLRSIEEFRQVIELEKAIWGYADPGDLVTVPVFIFTVKRGATLIGAFDPANRMVGFAYAVVGMKNGRPMHWSHMAGVLPEHRGGLGYRLKLEQRTRALAQGIDLIEWTFDPMQTLNAHFNFAKLGGVVEEYAENFYGESTSALHRGTPTDRLVLNWKIADPHVVRRLEQPTEFRLRAAEVGEAPVVNQTVVEGKWRTVSAIDLSRTDRRVWIEIPMGFTEMQQQSPALALKWRLDVRQMFQAYFGRGYRAVDFVLQREAGFGRYLLVSG
ncbi:MAG: GNAT family N-acetyltransferase [Vicinamibacterales bacterium]